MDRLNSRERLIRTIEGKEIDRIATFDIMHNIGLMEYLSGEKIRLILFILMGILVFGFIFIDLSFRDFFLGPKS